MVIDTSALIAILFGEPEALSFTRALADETLKLISSFNALETGIEVGGQEAERPAAGNLTCLCIVLKLKSLPSMLIRLSSQGQPGGNTEKATIQQA